MKKNWKVRFRDIDKSEWTEVKKPFKSQDSAEFFVATIKIVTPYLEAVAYEEEVCPNGKQ